MARSQLVENAMGVTQGICEGTVEIENRQNRSHARMLRSVRDIGKPDRVSLWRNSPDVRLNRRSLGQMFEQD